MRYDNLKAFEKYLGETKNFNLLYLILGKESFDCQEAVQSLLHFLLPKKEMRELALTIFEGGKISENELQNALDSGSFFTKIQVIWIQQAEKLKKPVQENLEQHFSYLKAGQYVILSAAVWQKNTHFYKMIAENGVVVELPELKPWEKEKYLIEWANQQMSASRKLISYSNCQALVRYTNHDQNLLAQEIEKLTCYCNDKKEITAQDINAICSNQHVDSVWILGEAIFSRNSAVALHTAKALLTAGHPLLPLLRQIRSQFQTDYQICLLLRQGKKSQDIALEFSYMKGQILDRHVEQAQKYGYVAFKKGLVALDAAEIRAKNSSINEEVLLELLITQLTIPMK